MTIANNSHWAEVRSFTSKHLEGVGKRIDSDDSGRILPIIDLAAVALSPEVRGVRGTVPTKRSKRDAKETDHHLRMCAAVPTVSVLAAPPNQTHLHLEIKGGDFWVCDGNGNGAVDPSDTHLEGTFWFNVNEVTDYDSAWNPLRITWTQSFDGLVTNMNTGELVVKDRFAGRDSLDLTAPIYTQSGATRHMFVPGEGTIYHSAGRISVNFLTGEVLWQDGPHPTGIASFCDLLEGAGPEISWEPKVPDIRVLGPH
jgi:hypothetical protein